MRKILFFLGLLSNCFFAFAQIDTETTVGEIPLEEVVVFASEPNFVSEAERKAYLLLKYRVKKVYPYAKLAAEKLIQIQQHLDSLPNNKQKKKYTKKIQEQTENQFSDELKKLTRTQGRILIKLVYRQTGNSAFSLVKNLRSGWRAFWYNSTANLYSLSLKSTYNPEEIWEDFLIEGILLRAFSTGELEGQNAAFPINYPLIEKQWKVQKNKHYLE